MVHEELTRTHIQTGSSDRAFGVVFAIAFVMIAAWPLVSRGTPHWWALGVAVAFALAAAVRPEVLAGPNRLWTQLGVLLGGVVSPVAMGIVFYAVLTPLGATARLLGKDPMRLKREPTVQSYWIPRQPPGPPPDSMTNQF